MERIIEFRGKRLDNGEWVYGDLHINCKHPHIHANVMNHSLSFRIAPETIGQNTGLKDRNGKEIYEGDIFDWYDPESDSPDCPLCGARCVVFYDKQTARFVYRGKSESSSDGYYVNDFDYYDRTNHVVVIGNIHDNPITK